MSQFLLNPEFRSIPVKKCLFSNELIHIWHFHFCVLLAIISASFKSKIPNAFCPAIFLHFQMVYTGCSYWDQFIVSPVISQSMTTDFLSDCPSFFATIHKLYILNWTRWVNEGKLTDNYWTILCLFMAWIKVLLRWSHKYSLVPHFSKF